MLLTVKHQNLLALQTINKSIPKMKFLIFAVAFVACAYADVSELGYNYEHPAPAPVAPQKSYIPPAPPAPVEQPKNTYIPPAVHAPAPAPVHVEQPQNTYIPPSVPAPAPVEQPQNTYIPPAVHVEEPKNTYIPPASATEDGYRYKTVRRVVYKNRA